MQPEVRVPDSAELFSRLCRMERDIASSTDLDELLGKIAACSREICDAEGASILLLDEDSQELYFKQVEGDLGEIVKKVRVPLSESSFAGHCLRNREPLIINDVASDPRHFKGVDRATSLTTRTLLAVPIVWGERCYGVAEAINKRKGGVFTEEDREMLEVLAGHAAVVLHNVSLMNQLQNFFVHTQELLVAALECIEPFSKGHVIRVTRLATRLGRDLGFTGRDYETLWYAAYFHDIGKLLLGTSFVARNDKLHPVTGANMLARIQVLEKTAPLVRHHHERWDGSGFPDHLQAEQCPLPARILSLVEDFDEYMMDRAPDQPLETYFEEFWTRSEGRHDPTLLVLFRKVAEEMKESYRS